jgi:NAD(P)-dependent dehydrogenase (short-subunit alcohol dehydrogenase family)
MSAASLRGRTALITGAARRLGRATALALADEGVNIVIHHRASAAEARNLRRELEARGVRAWPLEAELADARACEALIPRALEAAGALEILVNNAAAFPADTVDDLTRERLLAMVEVNAWAPFALGRSFARAVERGVVINFLDTRLRGYDPSHVAYIMSKHLLERFTRVMALEFAPGVRVNAVAPGLILPPAGKDETYLDRLAARVPLQRHGEPEQVAAAVVFLAQSEFITGQVIYVDGGRHLAEYAYGPHPD